VCTVGTTNDARSTCPGGVADQPSAVSYADRPPVTDRLLGHQVSRGRASPHCTRPYDLVMFMVTLTYLVDLSEVDAALPEHVAWLDQQYADGVFIASGRQVPRVGGLILVAGTNRDDLERRLALDPFGRLGLAQHAVIEFVPSRVACGLEQLLR